MLQLTGAQALVRALVIENVTYAFGIVGGKLAPLLHALAQQGGIRFVGVRHESTAAMMAAAAFAGSGQLALAIGEMGPGGLNLAAGMGTAFNNNLPLLAVTTNQHRAAIYPHSGMFMDMDTRAVFAPLTKWNAVVHDPRRIPELVRRALREAFSGRPGPVHLDIPQDVLSATCVFADDEFDLPPARYRATLGSRPAQEAVNSAIALLAKARHPLIVAGGGVITSGASSLVRDMAKLLNAPVIPTQMALGAVPTSSPHFIGHGGLISGDAVKAAFDGADVILSIGCRYSSWMWDEHGPFARRTHQLININVDPLALGHPAVHEIAMVADACLALSDLLAAWTAQASVQTPVIDTQWLGYLRGIRSNYEDKLAQMALSDERPRANGMHPAALAKAIADAMPADALVVYDGGHTSFWSNDMTPVEDVRTRFHDPGMCQLGFGLPYALSLQLHHPDRVILNITGDGSFGFTINELDTARRYGLRVINVIHNNAAWGIIRAGQRAQLDFEMGTELADTDYAAIARGFGCHGEVVDHPSEFAQALERALASGLPAVIDCHTEFLPHPAAPMFGSMNRFSFDALTR